MNAIVEPEGSVFTSIHHPSGRAFTKRDRSSEDVVQQIDGTGCCLHAHVASRGSHAMRRLSAKRV